jgi:hypothetical protein
MRANARLLLVFGDIGEGVTLAGMAVQVGLDSYGSFYSVARGRRVTW